MLFLVNLIYAIIELYVLIVILEVGLNWLIALEIVNSDNEAAKKLIALLRRFTEPAYKHLRKYIPPIGGFDMSPLILIIGIHLLARLVAALLGSLLGSMYVGL